MRSLFIDQLRWVGAGRSRASRRMRRLALCQFLQRGKITADQGLFLGATPFLQFALVFDGIADSIKPLREDQLHGPSSQRITLECSGIVQGHSDFQRRSCGSDIIAAVGTSEDVEPGSICHPSARPILRDAAKTPLLRMRLMDILSIQNSASSRGADANISRQKQKMAREAAPFSFKRRTGVCQPRRPSALSARRSIGRMITLVPTLTRE